MSRASAVLSLLLAFGCSNTGNALGTLRDNQVLLFEGQHWTEPRCAPGGTPGHNATWCCDRHTDDCPDFHEYTVSDVRVRGQRVAVLMTMDNGHGLFLSDDLGATWRSIAIGSIGGIATFQPASLHLAGNDVYLLVQTQFEGPFGGHVEVIPWLVNLEGSGATRVIASGSNWFFSRPLAWSGDDGTLIGVTIGAEDLRDLGGPCRVVVEKWKPGGPLETTVVPSSLRGCNEYSPQASDDGRFFPLLVEEWGQPACIKQIDVAANTAGANCVPWSQWPVMQTQTDERFFAAAAGKRAWRYAVFSRDDTAWAMTPTSPEWVSLGRGAPLRHWRSSGRQQYAGLVPLKDAAGAERFARINADGSADDVLLPLSPCTGGAASCWDPQNSFTFHGGIGDLHWAEPLGNDEYLMFYVHDVAPGINQYKPVFTVSKEKATYQRLTPLEKPASTGPAGYPDAKPAGLLEQWCLKRQACTAASFDFYNCVGATYLRLAPMQHPGLDAALAEVAAADCSNLLVQNPQAFACRAAGKTPVMKDNGQGQLFLECQYPAETTTAACDSCVGQFAVSCSGSPATRAVSDCAAQAKTCQAGACVTPTPCQGDGLMHCAGNVGTVCLSGGEHRTRCDLLNMDCNAIAAVPAWSPCVGKGNWTPSQTNDPLRCDGDYLLWHLNGQKYANCVELGFSACANGRCVP